jgi:hypothetical protein
MPLLEGSGWRGQDVQEQEQLHRHHRAEVNSMFAKVLSTSDTLMWRWLPPVVVPAAGAHRRFEAGDVQVN